MMSWEYLAGFTDGEGSIRMPSTSKSITANFSLVQSGNEGFQVLTEVKQFLETHGIRGTLVYQPRDSKPRLVKATRPIWYLGVYKRSDVTFIMSQLLPFLRVKRVQTQDILRFLKIFPPLTGKLNRLCYADKPLPTQQELADRATKAKDKRRQYQIDNRVKMFYESTLRGKCSCKIGLLPCQIHDWNMDANYK